jgi:hypothetical protein
VPGARGIPGAGVQRGSALGRGAAGPGAAGRPPRLSLRLLLCSSSRPFLPAPSRPAPSLPFFLPRLPAAARAHPL